MFHKVSGMEKTYENEGVIMKFCRDFSVSHSEKLRGGNLCV